MKKILIIGLGNIGKQYQKTRHNIGFLIIDEIIKNYPSFSLKNEKLGYIAKSCYKQNYFFLLKPSLYMNCSGISIKYWINKENIQINNIIVITDDINLSLGILRIRSKGSNGGHNGLKNIEDELKTSNYARLRFGIGNNFYKGEKNNYVLGKWTKEELDKIKHPINIAAEAALSFGIFGLQKTMNLFNNKTSYFNG
ncbi:MAG: aminoacyl-tRNA hydrolase [Candidatus Bostrichicola ureolyticus]|nr:MAG: aminoacyl-tRNA hydrolase [Candidatus Bostrichicola ureolyticus]